MFSITHTGGIYALSQRSENKNIVSTEHERHHIVRLKACVCVCVFVCVCVGGGGGL